MSVLILYWLYVEVFMKQSKTELVWRIN